MNEKIYTIARQADNLARAIEPDLREVAHYNRIRDEKFAELIIKECIDVVLEQKKWVGDMETLNPHDEFWNRARIQQSQHIIDKIRAHFGVKE